jgi:hypothetical protein
MGTKRNVYRFSVGKQKVIPLGRPRYKWEDNIKMDLKVSRFLRGGMDWIHLTQDRDQWQALVNAVLDLCVP